MRRSILAAAAFAVVAAPSSLVLGAGTASADGCTFNGMPIECVPMYVDTGVDKNALEQAVENSILQGRGLANEPLNLG